MDSEEPSKKQKSEFEEFELVTLVSGYKSLRSLIHRQTFHPVIGPWAEANILHVQQPRLIERCKNNPRFVIWDVGLGAAANSLAVIDALLKADLPEDAKIQIHSFDQTFSPLRFGLEHAKELGYLQGYENQLTKLLNSGNVDVSPQITWFAHLGDFRAVMKNPDLPAPHSILYDPYSPSMNSEMWSLTHLTQLFQILDPEVPCLWTNYTRSTAVRVSLLLAGFYVGRGEEIGEKSETTIASNVKNLIERPLDLNWLKKIPDSKNGAPIHPQGYAVQPISLEDFERLKQCPQFLTF